MAARFLVCSDTFQIKRRYELPYIVVLEWKKFPKGCQWFWKQYFWKIKQEFSKLSLSLNYFWNFYFENAPPFYEILANIIILKLLCILITYIANFSRWISFAVEEMNCNSLENICGCMVVLCGQSLLHRDIITDSLESFCIHWLIHETFPPRSICNCGSLCLTPTNGSV